MASKHQGYKDTFGRYYMDLSERLSLTHIRLIIYEINKLIQDPNNDVEMLMAVNSSWKVEFRYPGNNDAINELMLYLPDPDDKLGNIGYVTYETDIKYDLSCICGHIAVLQERMLMGYPEEEEYYGISS